ncbi:MAG: prephenate dehydrogenase [Candidatus Kryptonium sp.]
MFQKISIIGTGLIGGSIALSLKQSKQYNFTIIGFDADPRSLDIAYEIGAINKKASSIEDAVKDVDVIFLCTPLKEILQLLHTVSNFAKSGAIVTDVGSVKKIVLKEAEKIRNDIYFIGGHPMAGSEKKGITSADPFLFENAVYVLCPNFNVPLKILNDFIELIKLTGANIILLDPEIHDRVAGYISHLPQLLAVLLVNTVGNMGSDYLSLSGGGFKDLTRIASSQFEMWSDIISFNKDKIIEAIDNFMNGLIRYRDTIKSGKIEALKPEFDNAFKLRNEIPSSRKGFINVLYDVFIMVEDKPGVLSKISTALYEGGLNIKDIELLRVREGTGGTFRLSFGSENDAKKAIEIITSLGYKVLVR